MNLYQYTPQNVYRIFNNEKLRSKFVFLDLETNGIGSFSPPTQIPTQISYMIFTHDGEKLIERDRIIKGATTRNNDIPNSLSIETLEREGKPVGDVLEEFYSFISPIDIIICHNASFDIGLIYRYKSPPFPLRNVICTMKDTVEFCSIPTSYGYKWPKLKELAMKTNVEFEEEKFHDSLYDVEMLQRSFFQLKQKNECWKFQMDNE